MCCQNQKRNEKKKIWKLHCKDFDIHRVVPAFFEFSFFFFLQTNVTFALKRKSQLKKKILSKRKKFNLYDSQLSIAVSRTEHWRGKETQMQAGSQTEAWNWLKLTSKTNQNNTNATDDKGSQGFGKRVTPLPIVSPGTSYNQQCHKNWQN